VDGIDSGSVFGLGGVIFGRIIKKIP
jgi:hypothetical protein